MQQETGITAVAHAIQLSVAPVFLLSGIGAMLAVMTSRLARIIDRARVLETRLPGTSEPVERALHAELAALHRRARLINGSITLCTATALLVCALIATVFLGVGFMRTDMSVPVALLFIVAMVTFFAGLVLFLREVFVATASLRIGPHGPR